MKEREVLWCRERGINPWGWWLYTRRILPGLFLAVFAWAIVALAAGTPVTWQWAYKGQYIGQPIAIKQDVAGRIEMFCQHQPRETAAYLVEQLITTSQGRTLLKNMCAKMDSFVLAQCGRQLPDSERGLLEKAKPGYDATPENILAPRIPDATAPVNVG